MLTKIIKKYKNGYDTENPEILECPEGSNCEPSNENEEICKCKIDEKKD